MIDQIDKYLCLLKRNFPQFMILIITGLSFVWLIVMAFTMRSNPTPIRLEYRVFLENADYAPIKNPQISITEEVQHEDALFRAFAEAEDHLREQINSWLTILGFFGVVLGLLTPLVSYLLQCRTLAEEKDRIIKDCELKTKELVKKAEESAQAAMSKADSAINAASQAKGNSEATRRGAANGIGATPRKEIEGHPEIVAKEDSK